MPVLIDARPQVLDGDYEKGGIQVIVKELLDAGLLNGEMLTRTGETLSEQIAHLTRRPRRHWSSIPWGRLQPTGGLVSSAEICRQSSAPCSLAGVEGGLEDNVSTVRARV